MGLFDSYKDIFGEKEGEKKQKEKKSSFFKNSEDKIKDAITKVKEEKKQLRKQETSQRREPEKKEEDIKPPKKGPIKNDRSGFLLKLLYIIKKDMELLFRSRTSSLVVFLGPLLIIALVGLSFNTSSIYNIKVATYSESYSNLTESVIQNLNDQEYKVIRTVSQEECINGVKMGDYHMCVIFPNDMKVENNAMNELIIYVDESRMNLAYLISNSIFSKISMKEEELSLGMTQDLVNTINYAKSELEGKNAVIGKIMENSNADSKKVADIGNELKNLDLTINKTKFNFTKIEDEMEDIEEKYNDTDVEFGDLEDLLDGLKIQVNDAIMKMDEARMFKETSVQDFNNIETNLKSNAADAGIINAAIVNVLNDVKGIRVTDPESIVDPIKTKIEPVAAKKTHLSYLFPTLMVLMIMFISLLLSSTITITEKISTAYFRNFITPTSGFLFMIGNYLTNIILVMVQMAILLAVASYFFTDLIPALGSLILITLLLATIFILMGILTGYIFNSEETVTLGALSIGSVMLFFSNTILPIETLPTYIAKIIQYNPFVMGESMIKKVLLFGAGIQAIQTELIIMGCVIIVLVAGCFLARELTKRRL